MEQTDVAAQAQPSARCPYEWLARVLTGFALAEQALGQLSLDLKLSTKSGPLGSLEELRRKLSTSNDKRLVTLEKRVARWNSNRALRHLLAHCTMLCFKDTSGREMVITRTLPRDQNDVTPDRLWTPEEREELLRKATNDSRSIADQIANLRTDPAKMNQLARS